MKAAKQKTSDKTRLLTWIPIVISTVALAFSGLSTFLSYETYKKSEESVAIDQIGEWVVVATLEGLVFETRYHISNLSQQPTTIIQTRCLSGPDFYCEVQSDGKMATDKGPFKIDPGDTKLFSLRVVLMPSGPAVAPYVTAFRMMKREDGSGDRDRHVVLTIMQAIDRSGYSFKGTKLDKPSADSVRMIYLQNFPCEAHFYETRAGACFSVSASTARGNRFTSGERMVGILFGDEAVEHDVKWRKTLLR